jgi:hypothetical protein
MLHKFAVCLMASMIVMIGGAAPATQPVDHVDQAALERDYRQQTAIFGGQRIFGDGVLTVRLPRTDLWVQADMGEIPTAAGVESVFYFFRCSCGKDRVVGQFALADYEVDPTLDALRGGDFQIVSLAPMFSSERPKVMVLRFEAEGKIDALARTLKSATDNIGDGKADNKH